jgi:2-oxo-4-hydroxy-4-carboxy--5-ureidoimidazoline (OHCU) decarboxylase
VHDLPRQLTVEELAELFGGRTQLAERLARIEDPLGRAEAEIASLSEQAKIEALSVHPRIGESSAEQHGDEPEVLADLERLNRAYEEKFGFRFVVFVNRRPRSAILPVFRERLARTREEELETGLRELVAIARDRYRA